MTHQVEGTNDASCLSKCSAAEKGYFKDDFLRYFTSKCPRRAPLINLGYTVRASIINGIFEDFIKYECSNLKQIVSLGAGFDTLFFKIKQNFPAMKIVYYELDLPRVIRRKLSCITVSETLCKMIGEYTATSDGLASQQYYLVSLDLRNISDVKYLLSSRMDSNLPTLFLSECAITYLEESKSSALIELAGTFTNATFVTYEQVEPTDGFGLVMLRHFETLQSPLLSVSKYPTLQDQEQRYIQLGWQCCRSVPVWDAYTELVSASDRSRILRLEQFDEWEELYLKCAHYAVTVASKGSLLKWSTICHNPRPPDPSSLKSTPIQLQWELKTAVKMSRYGHSLVRHNDKLLLIGGFGVRKDNTHGRMKTVTQLHMGSEGLEVAGETEASQFATMYTTWTEVSSGRFVVYGGRAAPSRCVWQRPAMVTLARDGSYSSELVVDTCDVPPRWRHSATVVLRDGVNVFVVFGGRNSDIEVLGDTWMVDLRDDKSQRKLVKLPSNGNGPCARFSHSATVRYKPGGGAELWVVGGHGNEGPLSDVWCLELSQFPPVWRRLIAPRLSPRLGHAARLADPHRLLLVGGVNTLTHAQPAVTTVDLRTGHCQDYALPDMSPERCLLLINHCVILSEKEEEIWVIGGGGNCFSFGTFFNSHCVVLKLRDLFC